MGGTHRVSAIGGYPIAVSLPSPFKVLISETVYPFADIPNDK